MGLTDYMLASDPPTGLTDYMLASDPPVGLTDYMLASDPPMGLTDYASTPVVIILGILIFIKLFITTSTDFFALQF